MRECAPHVYAMYAVCMYAVWVQYSARWIVGGARGVYSILPRRFVCFREFAPKSLGRARVRACLMGWMLLLVAVVVEQMDLPTNVRTYNTRTHSHTRRTHAARKHSPECPIFLSASRVRAWCAHLDQ